MAFACLLSMSFQISNIPIIEANDSDFESVIRTRQVGIKMSSTNVDRNRELALLANEEIWNRGNFDNLEEMFADNFVEHFLPFGTQTVGLEKFRKNTVAHRAAFPDWTEAVNMVIAEGDYVALQFTSTGTNTGRFLDNPPTGKKVHINEMTIFRIVEGKIVELWLLPDIFSLNQQLGLITSDR